MGKNENKNLLLYQKNSATAGNTAGRARAMQGELKQGVGIIKCANF